MKIERLEDRVMLTSNLIGGVLTVTATAGADTIIVSKSLGGTYTVSVNAVVEYNSNTAITAISVDAGSGNDSINLGATSSPITVPATLVGYNGADTITGGAGNDSIEGGAGNDSIDGNLGKDTISGGADNDTVSYATRATAVTVTLDSVANDGAAGELDNVGSAGDVESIMGGSGADSLTGSAGANYISGGSGADTIKAGGASDTIVGGAGVDSLLGEDGDDYIFAKDGEIDHIDGGPGIDTADTDPAEAPPLPDPPPSPSEPLLATSAISSSLPITTSVEATYSPVAAKKPASPPKKITTFATKRIITRAAAPSARKLARKSIAAAAPASSDIVAIPSASEPLPTGLPGGYEKGVDAATYPQIIAPLDPYCVGQVQVTRDNQHIVNVTGTSASDPLTFGNDIFLIQTAPGSSGIQITNNGGFTEFSLQSDPIFINGAGGNDKLIISGGQGSSASYTPSGIAGSGTVTIDGHTIIYNNIGGANPLSFTNLDNLNYVTPNAGDAIHLGANAAGIHTQIDGSSGGVTLGPIYLLTQVTIVPSPVNNDLSQTTSYKNTVKLVTLDLGQNDGPAAITDSLSVDALGQAPPPFALLPGTAGTDNVFINSGTGFTLANDPSPDPASPPTVSISANGGTLMKFDSVQTHLANLTLSGNAAITPGGDKTLITNNLSIGGNGRLDITNNNLIVAPPGPSTIGTNIRNWIAGGYQPASQSHWNGLGITSSIAAGDSSKAVGFANADALFGASGGNFRGVTVDGNAVLVTFTLFGDADLDRSVGFSDLVKLAQNYDTTSGSNWLKGDFDFDGATQFSDLVSLAQNYDSHYP